jgi:MFS family permease
MVADEPGRPWPRSVRALGVRDFRLFFGGGLVSSVGTNMQVAALAWVVQAQTGSALRTTAIAFVGIVPLLLLGPAAGVLADRFARRRLLVVTSALNLAQAAVLWVVWIAGWGERYWLLFALSGIGGVFTALQTPAWQSLPAELVERRDLPNAITLNTTQFNIARALGPLFAGLVIDHLGAGAAFGANALSYFAVIVALLAMAPAPPVVPADDGLGTVQRWFQGVRYIRERDALMLVIGVHMVFSFVVPPIVYLVPKLAIDVLGVGASAYGALLGSFGIGAIAAAVVLNANEHRVARSRALVTGLAAGSAALLASAATDRYGVGVAAMALLGIAYVVVVSIDHGTIQTLTDDAHRGRVTSVWLMTFGLCMPIGVIGQGALADRLGVRTVLVVDGAILATAIAVLLGARLLGRLDRAVAHSNSLA